MESKNLKINWLGKCPKCERTEHTVTTLNGNEKFLYDDDIVECWCGQKGLIDSHGMGCAWCEWDEQPRTSLNDFNDYYREKFPSNWDLLPKSNHHACSHYYELLNAWQAAKASVVPEGYVLVEKQQLAQLLADMDYMGKKALGNDYVGFADVATILDELIEAQEPSNV